MKVRFISIDTGFNIPNFKNKKKFNRKYKCLYLDPKVKYQMKAITELLSFTDSESVTIESETLMECLPLLMTAWLLPGKLPRDSI
jgi:hypothetical protein